MKENPGFLKNQFNNLHSSEEVQSAAKRIEKRDGKKVSQKPVDRIQNYLDRFKEIIERPDEKEKERGTEALKKVICDKFVINPENVPHRAFELEQDIAEQGGYGRPEITEEFKNQKTNEIISDQEKSLDRWIDYLSSEDAMYSDWLKYWAFRSVIKMGRYNKEEEKFEDRNEDTIAPFPLLNPRALSLVFDSMEKKVNKEKIENNEINSEELAKVLETKNFSKLYSYILKTIPEFSEEGLENIKGEWIKYIQNSDHMPLVESIEGYPLEWCTAGEDTAKSQLSGGDFYVYYSEDNNFENKIPRLAIRMSGKSKIAEVRGIEKNQNIDQFIHPVLDEKLEDFGSEGGKYLKKSADMKKMTEITSKHRNDEELNRNDLRFLYEIDGKIDGFGYQSDPRIEEVKGKRDLRVDLSLVLDCSPEKISFSKNEALSANILFHYGDLDISEIDSAQGLKLPERVGGDLVLSNLVSVEGLKLPENIGGYLDLPRLISAEGLKLPESIGGDLSLGDLTSAKGLKFPKNIGGHLDLTSLTSVEGLKLPESIGGDLILEDLASVEGLNLPDDIGGCLYFETLTEIEKDTLSLAYPHLNIV